MLVAMQGDLAQWLERLTASPVMHVSLVRTMLLPCGVFRETSLFLPSQCDKAITLMAACRVKVVTSVSTLISQGPALRAPHTHLFILWLAVQ